MRPPVDKTRSARVLVGFETMKLRRMSPDGQWPRPNSMRLPYSAIRIDTAVTRPTISESPGKRTSRT